MIELIKVLEEAWDEGFFYHLRSGSFDKYEYEKLKICFENFSMEEYEKDSPDKKLVSLLWFIPLFIEWQKERLIENGVDPRTIEDMSSLFFNQCERILGMPLSM